MFCAICTSETGPFVVRPLGKGNAPVNVCEGCDDAHPRTGRYAFAAGGATSRTLAPGTSRTSRGGHG